MEQINCRFGALFVEAQEDLISKSLMLYGEWAQVEINLILNFIQPGGVVLDVGGYIGTHSLAFSRFVGPNGRVLTFEPQSVPRAALQKCLDANQLKNLTIYDYALGASEAILDSECASKDIHNDASYSLRIKHKSSERNKGILMRPLDSLGLDECNFIKIDVEGMEIDVLNGAIKTIERCKPVIFAECNSLEASEPIIKWCEKENYLIYGILCSAFNQENYAGNVENIFGLAQETALLLVPADNFVQYQKIIIKLELPQIKTHDDLALLLLHKPQYPHEVFAHASAAKQLTLAYPSPQSDKLLKVLSEREMQIASLNQSLSEREMQIASLNQSLSEREMQIASLNQSLSERDSTIQEYVTS
jgi:FkbM family methyltransferase